MDERIKVAVIRYLELGGSKILDEDFNGFLIFEDAGFICFAKIAWRFKSDYHYGKDFDLYSRSELEEAMFKWQAEHEHFGDIMHDMFNVVVFDEDKAMIIHIKDAQFAYERK